MYTYIYVFISMTYDSMYPLANQICLAGKWKILSTIKYLWKGTERGIYLYSL